jgi:hypothetical protein
MSSFNHPSGRISHSAGATIIDPADEHYEQSQADFRAYDSAISNATKSVEYLVEAHSEQFGGGGNPWSREGFDFDSFVDRS